MVSVTEGGCLFCPGGQANCSNQVPRTICMALNVPVQHYTRRAICRERGMLTSGHKQIKSSGKPMWLLEAVFLPKEVITAEAAKSEKQKQ